MAPLLEALNIFVGARSGRIFGGLWARGVAASRRVSTLMARHQGVQNQNLRRRTLATTHSHIAVACASPGNIMRERENSSRASRLNYPANETGRSRKALGSFTARLHQIFWFPLLCDIFSSIQIHLTA